MTNISKNRVNATTAMFRKRVNSLFEDEPALDLSNINYYDKQYEIDGTNDKWIKDSNNKIKTITISNIRTGNLRIAKWKKISLDIYNSEIFNITFDEDCEIEDLSITNCPNFGSIIIKNSKVKKVSIDKSVLTGFRTYNTGCEKIYFQKCTINELTHLNSDDEGLSFNSSTIHEITFNNIDLDNIIYECVFSKAIVHNILADNANILYPFKIINGSNLQSIRMVNSQKVGGLLVYDSILNNIYIDDCRYIERVDLQSSLNLQKISITNSIQKENEFKSVLNNFSVDNQVIPEGIIKDIIINNIVLKNNFKKDSILQFINIDFRSLLFEDFNNYGSLKFSNLNSIVNTNTDISIQNSDLGKTQFIGCDLEKSNLEFINSKLLEIFVIGTDFPNSLNYNNINRLEQQRLALGQLQKVYENNGDNVRATSYQANNLETHREQLISQLPLWLQRVIQYLGTLILRIVSIVSLFFNRVLGTWLWNDGLSRRDRSDLISLSLNNISSNYGNSLSRAFWVTIIFSSFLFLLYCRSANLELSWNSVGNTDTYSFSEIVGYYLEFLSPIHRSDFMFNEKINGSTRILDAIGRIINSYMLYQFIQAFRKYGKKG